MKEEKIQKTETVETETPDRDNGELSEPEMESVAGGANGGCAVPTRNH